MTIAVKNTFMDVEESPKAHDLDDVRLFHRRSTAPAAVGGKGLAREETRALPGAGVPEECCSPACERSQKAASKSTTADDTGYITPDEFLDDNPWSEVSGWSRTQNSDEGNRGYSPYALAVEDAMQFGLAQQGVWPGWMVPAAMHTATSVAAHTAPSGPSSSTGCASGRRKTSQWQAAQAPRGAQRSARKSEVRKEPISSGAANTTADAVATAGTGADAGAKASAGRTMRFCPYCGSRVSPDHNFCRYCGSSLAACRGT